MTFFSKRIAESTRLACAVGVFALAAGLAPAGGAIAQQASDSMAINMADEHGTTVSTNASAMMARAQEQGEISIIVGLNTSFTPEGSLSAPAVAGQRAGIAAMQAQMMGALEAPSSVREFETVPYMAMTVSPEDLSRVMNMPGVMSIHEDVPVPPTLGQSVPVTKANRLWQKGHRGNSTIVAVLDTGVRTNHVAFRDPGGRKLVASACFNTNNSIASSLCPNGNEKQLHNGNGSAAPDCNRFAITGCGHGTHVAAIAAGFQRGNHGVAQRSDIISINVFSEFSRTSDCGSSAPCVLSYSSDQMAGLEQVLKWKNAGRNIAAANMSLGGGRFFSHCDSDPLKSVIDNLKSAGVATVIASGNNGYDDSVGAPSCISTAVNVGSTTNSDDISSFSNVDQMNDLLAPGSSIMAADSSNGTSALRSLSGTSMATPHVAGAFALLKDGVPSASVDQIERALKCTGYQVSRNDTPKPRIWVNRAYDYLKSPDRNRTFNFNQPNSVKQFSEILGNWFHLSSFMRVVANTSNEWYLAQAPFCGNDMKVTAELKRIDPDTGFYWNSGVMLSSTASSDGKISGLAFMYYVDPNDRTTATVWQFDNINGATGLGDATNLCTFEFNGRDLGQKRKLVAIKRGNTLTFRIDGRQVCSVQTDARYTDGHVAVLMAAPSNDSGHKLDVHSLQMQTFKQSSTVTAVSSAQPSISGNDQTQAASSISGAAAVSN